MSALLDSSTAVNSLLIRRNASLLVFCILRNSMRDRDFYILFFPFKTLQPTKSIITCNTRFFYRYLDNTNLVFML